MYALITNGIVEKYPYTIGNLRKDNPHISFPRDPSEILKNWGVFPVALTARPDFDDMTQNLVEGAPALVDGVWTQVWIVADATTEEVTERQGRLRLQAQQNRATAYGEEADPLFFKAQRGEIEISEWHAKVQEIRARYPYPVV